MTWIGELLELNLAEEWPFLSAHWQFDIFLLRHSGNKIIPSSPHPKITQCLVKLLSICASDDDWGHSLKMMVNNYEDDYLKTSYLNKTMLFLSSKSFSQS